MPPTPATNGRTDKASKKQSKVVILNIPPSILKRFLPKTVSPSIASSPAPTVEDVPQLKTLPSQENKSETNSTPAPTQDVATPGGTSKNIPPLVNGVKRCTPIPSDNMQKPRGKPGPKKKPRLEDGTIDHSAKPANTGTANHKLGPKANTGFINANLRALDRSGAPCRRWQKKGFQLKSFTGHTWELPSWKGTEKTPSATGTEGSTQDVSMPDGSEQKPSESDTAAGSNAGEHPDRMEISTPTASSPPPIPASAPTPIPT